MKALLNEIDDLLAHFEDFTHGKDGENITKIRGKISKVLSEPKNDSSQSTFTEEEVESAKNTRDAIIKGNISELKSIYVAGEIVMWDELQEKQKENDRCLNELQKICQKKIVPTDPVFVIGKLGTIDLAIEYYIDKLELEIKQLKKQLNNGND